MDQNDEKNHAATLIAAARSATGKVDIASRTDQRRIRDLADELAASDVSTEALQAGGADQDRPLDLRVAVKLALSKRAMRRLVWSGRLGVVFAMWGERRRLRHMQRMVGRAIFGRGLRDTQAAFKLYGAATLADILAAPSTYGFAFDSDWLYAAIATGRSIESVPFAFIDSFTESASIAQGPMTTWESLLRGLVDAARARAVDHDEEMAAVIDDYAYASNLDLVVQNVPPQLAGVADGDLGHRQLMTPDALRDWLDEILAGT